MKRQLSRGLVMTLAWLLLSCTAALAATPAPPPRATSLLVDQTNLLTAREREEIDARLQAIEASGKAQVGVLIATGTGSETLQQYALRVAEAWQLGRRGRDDGVLVLVVPARNALRIEVGYGLEGTIPDALAARWIDEVLPDLAEKRFAEVLHRLLERIEVALPEAAPLTKPRTNSLDAHPEWKLPFVLVVFSPLAIFPLFLGAWGALLSAPILATIYGLAAWELWGTQAAAGLAAAISLPLPVLWGLNGREIATSQPVLRWARAVGNLAAVVLFFLILALFVGMGLQAADVEQVWVAPLFALLLAIGLAAFLFPRATRPLLLALRSLIHFAFMLALSYGALSSIAADPAPLAVGVSALFAILIAIGLLLDRREQGARLAGGGRAAVRRWSSWFVAAALLLMLPFALLLLMQALAGDDFQTRVAQASAGGGSIAAILWWAARRGFFAMLVGLGGRFGGGGAGRGD